MSLSYSVVKRPIHPGNLNGIRVNVVRITFDNAYAQAGYAISATGCGMDSTLLALYPLGLLRNATPASATTGYIPSFDQPTGKLQVFVAGSGAVPPTEVAGNFATINGFICDFLAIGL